MNVTETKSEGLVREFKIAVPASDIEEKTSARLKEMAQTVRLPGFRPGKVPVSLLRKRFGDALHSEVVEQIVNDSTGQLITERGLRAAGEPRIEVTSSEPDADIEYTLALEVLPEISQPDYGKIALERLVAESEDAEIDERLERIADVSKTAAAVTEARPAQSGDVVVIDFVGRIDGEEFAGGSAEGYELTLGSGAFIPGFEDQLVGAEVGEMRAVTVDFPAEYGAAELAGKTAVFDVTVKEIREMRAAAVDDSLAKQFGQESVADLRNVVAETEQRNLKAMSRIALKRSLLDCLAGMYDFDVPPTMVENEYVGICAQLSAEKREREHADDHDHDHAHDHDHSDDHDHDRAHDHAHDGPAPDATLSDDEKAEYRALAQRRVRLGLVLAEVARVNNLQITADELRRAMYAEASRFPGQERAVLDYYEAHPEVTEALAGPILEDKVVDFMLEMGTVSERRVTPSELRKVLDETDDYGGPTIGGAAAEEPVETS